MGRGLFGLRLGLPYDRGGSIAGGGGAAAAGCVPFESGTLAGLGEWETTACNQLFDFSSSYIDGSPFANRYAESNIGVITNQLFDFNSPYEDGSPFASKYSVSDIGAIVDQLFDFASVYEDGSPFPDKYAEANNTFESELYP